MHQHQPLAVMARKETDSTSDILPFPVLPDEINTNIFNLFDRKTMVRISLVCHLWNRFSNRSDFWQKFHRQELDKFYVSPKNFTERQLFFIKQAASALVDLLDEEEDDCIESARDMSPDSDHVQIADIFARIDIPEASVMVLSEYLALERQPKFENCYCEAGLCKLQKIAHTLWRSETENAWKVALYMLNNGLIANIQIFITTVTRNYNFFEYLINHFLVKQIKQNMPDGFGPAYTCGVIYAENIYEHLVYEAVLLCIPTEKRGLFQEEFIDDVITGSAYRPLVKVEDENSRLNQVFRMIKTLRNNDFHRRGIENALEQLPEQWPERAENKLELDACFFDKLSNIKGALELFQPLLLQLTRKRSTPPAESEQLVLPTKYARIKK